MVNETKHKSSGQMFSPIQTTVSAIIALVGEGPLASQKWLQMRVLVTLWAGDTNVVTNNCIKSV